MKKLAHGTLFAVPLPDGTYLPGRVILDIYGCFKRRLFSEDSPLPGLGKGFLVEMYSKATNAAEFCNSRILIPGAFVETDNLAVSWPVVGHLAVNPRTVEFPESLVCYMHQNGEVAFECGEIRIPLPLELDDLDRIGVLMGRHSAYYWPYICLKEMGREAEFPDECNKDSLAENDLRFSAARKKVYKHLPFKMKQSYYEKQKQMGLNLERLYEKA